MSKITSEIVKDDLVFIEWDQKPLKEDENQI